MPTLTKEFLITEVIEILFYISWLRHELDQIVFCWVNTIAVEENLVLGDGLFKRITEAKS